VVAAVIAISGSLCASAIIAMLVLDSSANRIAVLRLGQPRVHSNAPAAPPTAAKTVHVSEIALRGPLGAKTVKRPTADKAPAMNDTVRRVRASIPRACKCALSRS